MLSIFWIGFKLHFAITACGQEPIHSSRLTHISGQILKKGKVELGLEIAGLILPKGISLLDMEWMVFTGASRSMYCACHEFTHSELGKFVLMLAGRCIGCP